MLKQITLIFALLVLTLTQSVAATTENLKSKAIDKAKQINDKAKELKDMSVDKAGGMGSGKAAVSIEVFEPWAASSSSATSAIYMIVKNPLYKDITLTHITAPQVANKVAIHQTITDNGGLVRMVDIDKVVIPAGSEVEFRPNGLHVMLKDLKKALKAGEKFKITLKFDDNSSKVIEVQVQDRTM